MQCDKSNNDENKADLHEGQDSNEFWREEDNNIEESSEEWKVQFTHHKSLGDTAFRSKDFSTAISEYTLALTFDPDNHLVLSNRSAAYLSNSEKSRALSDAKRCIEVEPEFLKGHSRLAAATFSLGRYNDALEIYNRILCKDGKNQVALKNVIECTNMIESQKEKVKEEQHAKKKQEEEDKEKEEDNGGDLLDDFFDEVEEQANSNENSLEKNISIDGENNKGDADDDKSKHVNHIQIQLSDLGSAENQISRLLCNNHQWFNLNPFRVMDCSHLTTDDELSRRYKALSLLLHPDKASPNLRDKATEAFEYVRVAMNTLRDNDKAKHVKDLITQGMKLGKRDFEQQQQKQAQTLLNNRITKDCKEGEDTQSELERCQEKAVMKLFADIERKRREVERRKRSQEKRERDQEDAEEEKLRKERDFEKKWKQDERVEKRIGNWRDFQGNKFVASNSIDASSKKKLRQG